MCGIKVTLAELMYYVQQICIYIYLSVCWRGLCADVVFMVLIDPISVHSEVYISMLTLVSVNLPFQLFAYSFLGVPALTRGWPFTLWPTCTSRILLRVSVSGSAYADNM